MASAATEREHRRRTGTYYTPDHVADVLVEWALPHAGRVMDPSCGTGNFLRAAHRVLVKSGERAPQNLLFGIDIDAEALRNAARLGPGRCIPQNNLRVGNFLQLDPTDRHAGLYNAIVGNPPYVRHHWLDAPSAQAARTRLALAGSPLSARASLWAYFTLHATSFLAPGGRLAFLLPGAVLSAAYSADVLRRLTTLFGDVWLIRVAERLFDETDEETVVLLASNRGQATHGINTTEVADIEELSSALRLTPPRRVGVSTAGGLKTALLPQPTQEALEAVRSSTLVHNLGHVATIRIGTVTGANDFFVRTWAEARRLSVATDPIVPRGGWLKQPTWTPADQSQQARRGAPTRLLRFKSRPRSVAQLAEIKANNHLAERHHCRNRVPWYVIQPPEVSPLFLPYMGAVAPRLVLNMARALSTNAIHRVDVKSPASPVSLAIASWTSLFALTAEMHGRHYGGGVLKLEPSEAQHILVALPAGVDQILPKLDELARAGRSGEAVELADQTVLIDGLGMDLARVDALRKGVSILSQRRRPRRPGGD